MINKLYFRKKQIIKKIQENYLRIILIIYNFLLKRIFLNLVVMNMNYLKLINKKKIKFIINLIKI